VVQLFKLVEWIIGHFVCLALFLTSVVNMKFPAVDQSSCTNGTVIYNKKCNESVITCSVTETSEPIPALETNRGTLMRSVASSYTVQSSMHYPQGSHYILVLKFKDFSRIFKDP